MPCKRAIALVYGCTYQHLSLSVPYRVLKLDAILSVGRRNAIVSMLNRIIVKVKPLGAIILTHDSDHIHPILRLLVTLSSFTTTSIFF